VLGSFLTNQQNPGMETQLYFHVFDLRASVASPDPSGEDVTAEDLRQAFLHRIRDVDDFEMLEACGYVESYKAATDTSGASEDDSV
jgi:hypothetical protein